MSENKNKNKICHFCQNQKINHLDNCDNCHKSFCYGCLGRIENSLYCEPCYRQKAGLKNTDEIIKCQKRTTEKGSMVYSWEVRKKISYK